MTFLLVLTQMGKVSPQATGQEYSSSMQRKQAGNQHKRVAEGTDR